MIFNPETKRYIAKNAKKSPKGSDLNQPINPREKIGIEIEKINKEDAKGYERLVNFTKKIF